MSEPTIQQAFLSALQLHKAGRFAEAKKAYQHILSQQPSHALTLHHLGLLAHQAGRNDIAVDLIRKAIEVTPAYGEAFLQFRHYLPHHRAD